MDIKIFTIFIFLVVTARVNANQLSIENLEKIGKTMHEIMEKCRKQTGLSPEDVSAFKDPKAPLTRNDKCLMACFTKEAGIKLDGDKIVDKFGYSDIIEREDPEYYKMSLNIVKECNEEVPQMDDECEYSGLLYKCHMEKAEQRSVDIPSF
uniref:Odorant binging protein n=1 Tax=Agrilus zanthoxylumi TaxID=2696312 RepID=A0A8A6HX01_9COLE|nr:odorant binging protein [Agrilus zanthoxylumi]